MIKETTAKNIRRAILPVCSLLLLLFGAASIHAQNKPSYQDDGCGNVKWGDSGLYGNGNTGAFNLEIKEQSLTAPAKKLSIDAGKNGGIRVVAWNRSEVSVKACVQASGRDEAEARRRTAAVRIETADGVIRAVLPSGAGEDYSFGASYDIRVPENTDLSLKTNNGGINLSGIRGAIEFDLKNGGVVLDKIAGQVRGQTVNGSLNIKLSGDRWDGSGIDARTTNGSISISFPENFSARLETATKRGKFYVNFPVEKTPNSPYELNLDLGTGGAVIKTSTVNGQITIKRQAAAAKENNL